jgi:hypothetical protein
MSDDPQRPDRMPRPGDRVKLRAGTLLWAEHYDIRNQVGIVKGIVDDGTSLYRISVEVDGQMMFVGVDAGSFEYAGTA